ncbi:hypothetical protein NYE76_29550, partial [Paenibacillus sp. FSL M7-0831]
LWPIPSKFYNGAKRELSKPLKNIKSILVRNVTYGESANIYDFEVYGTLATGPINLTANAQQNNISLSWNTIEGAESYTLQRSLVSGGPYESVATNVTNATYTDTNIMLDTTYYYIVKAISNGNEVLASNEASAIVHSGSNPNEPEPKGNRAILTITLTTGLEKEYDLSMDEVNSFIEWYDAKDTGTGPVKYAINKHSNNKGPFSKRTDYVIFNNILTFEVNEYNTASSETK